MSYGLVDDVLSPRRGLVMAAAVNGHAGVANAS